MVTKSKKIIRHKGWMTTEGGGYLVRMTKEGVPLGRSDI